MTVAVAVSREDSPGDRHTTKTHTVETKHLLRCTLWQKASGGV